MFCKNCGTQIVEGELCSACATESENSQVQAFSPENEPKKKKSPVIAVILAIIAVIVLGYLLFGKAFGGSALKDYQSIERKNLETLKAHTSNIAQFTGVGSSNNAISLTFTDDGKSFMDSKEANWINTLFLDMNSSSDETRAHSSGTLSINDTKIISFETLTELPGNEIFLKLSDFSNLYIKTNSNSNYMKLFRSSSPDMDAVNAVVGRYGDIIIDNIDKVEKGKESVTVGETTTEYTTYVVTIDSETSTNIARKTAATAREDSDLEKLIRSSAEESGEDADAAYADFLAKLDEAENREDDAENTVLATMTLYVDKKGEVCGRRYVDMEKPDEVNYYLTAWNGKNFESEVSLATDDGQLYITGSGSRDGDKISGDYTVRSGDILVANIRVDEFDKKAVKDGKLIGSFTFTPGKDYIDETGENPMMASLRYKIDLTSESGKMDFDITIFSDDAHLATLKINSTALDGGEVPSVGDDEKVDFNAWMKAVDLDYISDTITNLLINAGAPAEMLN